MYVDLIRQLYSIHSITGFEWPLITFIQKYVSNHIPEAKVAMDRFGNLYVQKGESEDGYPTLACHLDQAQKIHSADFEVHQDVNMLYGWSEQNQRREGLGADDKNGIYICLRCLEMCPRLKVFMSVSEEKGCIGSNRADMSFFHDSLYVLEPDCKGSEGIHVVLRGIPCASEEFIEALKVGENGYIITEGKTSDILALTLNGIGVSCANIPAGYHQPHKDEEYTIISELEHSLAYISDFITNEKRRFPHIYKSETQIMAERFLKNNQLKI